MANDEFYTSMAWRKMRAQIRKRDRYKCHICGADVRGPGKSRVDHIQTVKDRPDLRLSPSNLRTLCVPCDNARHAEKNRNVDFTRTNESGLPVDPDDPFYAY